MTIDHEAHYLPLTNRIVSDAVREWLDRRTATALAANPDGRQAIEQMRHLHLDDYWYTLVPQVLDTLRRATVTDGQAG